MANCSAISGHPDIPCFLLLDDPANELLLSAGLGAHRILTSEATGDPSRPAARLCKISSQCPNSLPTTALTFGRPFKRTA
jgi:hypothetical protein